MQPSKERIFMACDYVKQKGAGLPVGHPEFSPLIYAVDSFFSIVYLHQESFWLPRESGWTWLPNWLVWSFKTYLWIHIAFGWIFTSLAVDGLTGIVKKD